MARKSKSQKQTKVANPQHKSKNIAACFRPDEQALLEKAANKADKSLSAFMREAVLRAAGAKPEVRGPGRPRKTEAAVTKPAKSAKSSKASKPAARKARPSKAKKAKSSKAAPEAPAAEAQTAAAAAA